ncbi:MAG: YCF48-related protein [Blastocatellia bacterium]
MKISARFFLNLAGLFLPMIAAHAQWQTVRQDDARCDSKGTRCDLNAVFFADKENGWVVGERGIIRATQNEGERWAAQDAGVKTALNDIAFSNKKEGFIVASGARIYRTLDGGNTWSLVYQIIAPKNASKQELPELYSIALPSKKKGWVVGTEGRIFHTEDGGQTWAQQESGTKEELRCPISQRQTRLDRGR